MFLPDTRAGTQILAGEYQSEHECDGYVMDEGWKDTAYGNDYDPSHWMPKPPAPKGLIAVAEMTVRCIRKKDTNNDQP